MITEIVILIIALLCLTAGIFLLCGKGKWLIAGYNTLSKEERKKYNEKKVCRAAGVICIICCVFLCAVAYMGYKVDSGMMSEADMLIPTFVLLAVLIAAVIAAGVYISRKAKGNEMREEQVKESINDIKGDIESQIDSAISEQNSAEATD